jgi:hypothetical protein
MRLPGPVVPARDRESPGVFGGTLGSTWDQSRRSSETGLSLWLGESDSAGSVLVYASPAAGLAVRARLERSTEVAEEDGGNGRLAFVVAMQR